MKRKNKENFKIPLSEGQCRRIERNENIVREFSELYNGENSKVLIYKVLAAKYKVTSVTIAGVIYKYAPQLLERKKYATYKK